MNIFVKSAIFLVIVIIVFGYFVAGSPQAERLRRFDERRVSDLQQIQSQIVEFWRLKERLPDSLGELRDEIRGFVPPKDPETGEAYEYRKIGELSFELCAEFKTSNKEENSRAVIYKAQALLPSPEGFVSEELWWHDAGINCFERTIDPELVPPYRTLPSRD